jgi:prephenate dehydrogenase
MADDFGRLTILGLGLIGGSLAKALRRKNAVHEVVGWGHREASLQAGVQLGVIDRYTLDLADAVRDADIVVIATPTLIAETTLENLAPLLGANTIVTDVASVKGNLLRCAERVFGAAPPNLVLAHPIAGSEKSGVAAANADLFVDHRVIVTPTERTSAQALETIERMWRVAGADVSQMSVDDHDAILAATSHLPHVLAFTLVDALAGEPAQREIFRYAAGGFRDFTRIAGSDPKMWHDITLANRPALLAALDVFDAHLATIRAAIDRSDSASIMAAFSRAKESRDQFAEQLKRRASNISDE